LAARHPKHSELNFPDGPIVRIILLATGFPRLRRPISYATTNIDGFRAGNIP
jgi:hypothetical protein